MTRKRVKELVGITKKFKLFTRIQEIVKEVEEDEDCLLQMSSEARYLGIINKVNVNRYLNNYVSQIISRCASIQKINDKILNQLISQREDLNSSELLKLYLENKKLENDQLRLIQQFCQLQEVQLDQQEKEVLIMYRSLPDHLKLMLYKHIMEFVRSCPSIIKALKAKQEELEKEKKRGK